jgi:Fe-S-cluster-containing hydrogenase component 2
VDVCPVSAITVEDGLAVVNEECIGCGACESTCPEEAIAVS